VGGVRHAHTSAVFRNELRVERATHAGKGALVG